MRLLWSLAAIHSYAASTPPAPPQTVTNLTVSTVLHVWQSILAWDPDGCKTMEHLLEVELAASREWTKLAGTYRLMTQDKIWRILTHIFGGSFGTYGHLGHWNGGHRMADSEKLGALKAYLSNFGNRHKGYLGGGSQGRMNFVKAIDDLHVGLVKTVKFYFEGRNRGSQTTNAVNQTTNAGNQTTNKGNQTTNTSSQATIDAGNQSTCRFIVTKNCSPYSAPVMEIPCDTAIKPYFAGYCDCGWGIRRRVNCGTESDDAFTCKDTCLAGGMSEDVETAFADVFNWIIQYTSMSACCGSSSANFDSAKCEFVTTLTYVSGATDAWCEKGEAITTERVQTCFGGIGLGHALRHTASSWQLLLEVDPTGCAMMDNFYDVLLANKAMKRHLSNFSQSTMKDSMWKSFTNYWGAGPRNYGLMSNVLGTGFQYDPSLVMDLYDSLSQLGKRHQDHSKDIMTEALEMYENALIESLKTVIGAANPPKVQPIGSLSTANVRTNRTSITVDDETYDKYADFGDNCRFYWRQEGGYEEGAENNNPNHVYSKQQTMKIHVVARCYFPVETADDIGWCAFGIRKSTKLDISMMAYGDIMYFDSSAKIKRGHTVSGQVEDLTAKYHFFNPADLTAKWVNKQYCEGKFSFTEWQVSRSKNTAQTAGGGYDDGLDQMKLTYAMGKGSNPTSMHFYAEAYELGFVAESAGQKPAARLSNAANSAPVASGNVRCLEDNNDPNCSWFFQDAPVYTKEDCVCESCKTGFALYDGKCVAPPEGFTTAMESAWRDVFRWMGNMMRMNECCSPDQKWNPNDSECTVNDDIMHGVTFLQNGKDEWCHIGPKLIAGTRDFCDTLDALPEKVTFQQDTLYLAEVEGDMDPPVSVYYWKEEKERVLKLYFLFANITSDVMWCAAGINPSNESMDGGHIVASVRRNTTAKEYKIEGRTPLEVIRDDGGEEGEVNSLIVPGSVSGHFGQKTCGVYMRVNMDILKALGKSSVLKNLIILSAVGKQEGGIPDTARLAESVGSVSVNQNVERKCDGGCGEKGICEDGKCNCKSETTLLTGDNCATKYCGHGKLDASGTKCECESGYKGAHCDVDLFLFIAIGAGIVGMLLVAVLIICCVRKSRKKKLAITDLKRSLPGDKMIAWNTRGTHKSHFSDKSSKKKGVSGSEISRHKDSRSTVKSSKKNKDKKENKASKSKYSKAKKESRSESKKRSDSNTSRKSKDSGKRGKHTSRHGSKDAAARPKRYLE
eukprot:GEMP01001621.1.p1 GENE.GEMP01001621.1~~GEMP01001621.1.p1  ORF type:complete len:1237 (-),score=214.24 GEMP01001621.1:1069-4779(-)